MAETSDSTTKIRKPRLSSFVSRNLVAIVMIPTIIGFHYGWNLLQDNRVLVPEDEQKDLPVFIFANYCWNRLTGKGSDEKSSSTGSASE